MDYLLDTHVLVWSLTAEHKLSSNAASAIEDPLNRIFVSSISWYEIGFKVKLGKWPDAEVITRQSTYIMTAMRFLPLAIQAEHALKAAALPLEHRDPFDRILVAQAVHETMTLITKDDKLGRFQASVLW